jgi:hypothetical protein
MSGTDLHELFARAVADAPPMSTGYPHAALDAGRARRRRARTRTLVAGVVVLSVAAAGVVAATRTHHSSAAPTTHSHTTYDSSFATEMWKDFPVDEHQRPIVMAGESIVGPDYPSGVPKEVSTAGSVEVATSLPDGTTNADGYPLITPQAAVAALRQQVQRPSSGPVLRIVGVELGAGDFTTDRGRQRLPGWQITLQGIADPVIVLAVASPAVFDSPMPYPSADRVAGLSSSSRTLTIEFVGAHEGTGPCEEEYTALVTQARWAVSVFVQALPKPAPTGVVECDLVGYDDHLTVRLDQPLGNRVLVDEKGQPMPLVE